jgi:hypothetical protein
MIEGRLKAYAAAKEWKKGLPLAELLVESDPQKWDSQELLIYFEHSTLMSAVSSLSDQQSEHALKRHGTWKACRCDTRATRSIRLLALSICCGVNLRTATALRRRWRSSQGGRSIPGRRGQETTKLK